MSIVARRGLINKERGAVATDQPRQVVTTLRCLPLLPAPVLRWPLGIPMVPHRLPTTRSSYETIAAKRVRLRNDHAQVGNVRRGGVAKAFEALEPKGLGTLMDELYEDREAPSGKDSKESHWNTWLQFHYRIFGEQGDDSWCDVLPITRRNLIPIAALFKDGGSRSYRNYISCIKGYHMEVRHRWRDPRALSQAEHQICVARSWAG